MTKTELARAILQTVGLFSAGFGFAPGIVIGQFGPLLGLAGVDPAGKSADEVIAELEKRADSAILSAEGALEELRRKIAARKGQ